MFHSDAVINLFFSHCKIGLELYTVVKRNHAREIGSFPKRTSAAQAPSAASVRSLINL